MVELEDHVQFVAAFLDVGQRNFRRDHHRFADGEHVVTGKYLSFQFGKILVDLRTVQIVFPAAKDRQDSFPVRQTLPFRENVDHVAAETVDAEIKPETQD